MQDWEIQFLWSGTPTPRLVHRVLYSLVAEGARYNAGTYPGSYLIVPVNPDEQIRQKATSNAECTERLADIVETYADFDPTTTEIGIELAYTVSSDPIHFTVAFHPTDDGQCVVELEVTGSEIQSEDRFRTFLELAKAVFERVGFEYGAHRSEYDEPIPTTSAEFLQESVRTVTFYSTGLADEFGRKRLLSSPAEVAVEIDDGSVMLVVCSDPQGCGDKYHVVNQYLDLEE